MFSVYIKQSAVRSAEVHFTELARSKLEGLGLLLGEVCEHKGQGFIVVDEFVTTTTPTSPLSPSGSSATAVSVRFSPTGLGSLAQLLKTRLNSAQVVGWCHSHPGYGCFLSSTDVSTQRGFFNEYYHIAAVFDPLKLENYGEVSSMAKRFYQLEGNGYKEVSFAVFK